jgi:hypothetical protein
MTTDFDISWPFDRFEGSEKRQFNLDLRKLGGRDGREPRIRAAGFDCAARHNLWKWFVGLDMADTSAQIASLVQRDECAAEPPAHLIRVSGRRRNPAYVPGYRLMRDAEE